VEDRHERWWVATGIQKPTNELSFATIPTNSQNLKLARYAYTTSKGGLYAK